MLFFFFAGGGVVQGTPKAGGHRLVESQGHDEQQAIEAVGIADLGILHPEAARFEIREHRVSRPEEFHFRPLAELCMRLSPHTAPIRQTRRSYLSASVR